MCYVIQNLPDGPATPAPLKSAIKADISATRNRSVKIARDGGGGGGADDQNEGDQRASSATPDSAPAASSRAATPQQRGATTTSGSDSSSDDEDEEESSGRVTTKAGYDIDRKSAGNLKRTKEEAAADPEPENNFGYTDRE